jgi:hypothetical protein
MQAFRKIEGETLHLLLCRHALRTTGSGGAKKWLCISYPHICSPCPDDGTSRRNTRFVPAGGLKKGLMTGSPLKTVRVSVTKE